MFSKLVNFALQGKRFTWQDSALNFSKRHNIDPNLESPESGREENEQ
jgi:hypothetical protein